MDTTESPPTVDRDEAARLLGCSVRTVDRRIPPGTPGRTEYGSGPIGKVQIERRLVEALLPAPGGDDVADTE